MSDLPTPRTTLGHATVAGHCPECSHNSSIDLAALIARGRGDVPLIRLPLRCTKCGSRAVGVIVSGIVSRKPGN
jgi:hypothetical protein